MGLARRTLQAGMAAAKHSLVRQDAPQRVHTLVCTSASGGIPANLAHVRADWGGGGGGLD